MKIAISSTGESVDSEVDQRFGRCRYFVVADTEDTGKVDAVENQGAIEGHGAGIKAAQQMGELDVKAVITGSVGPNANAVLDKLGIEVYHASGTVKEAIEAFAGGRLEKMKEVAAPHSGMIQQRKEERIFFPLLDNNGEDSEISAHFGHAPFFGVYDVEKRELKITKNDLDHSDPDKSPIDQIEEAVNPTTIFAKGIGGRAIQLIAEKGLTLKTGNYRTVRDVIKNLDKLENQEQSCGH